MLLHLLHLLLSLTTTVTALPCGCDQLRPTPTTIPLSHPLPSGTLLLFHRDDVYPLPPTRIPAPTVRAGVAVLPLASPTAGLWKRRPKGALRWGLGIRAVENDGNGFAVYQETGVVKGVAEEGVQGQVREGVDTPTTATATAAEVVRRRAQDEEESLVQDVEVLQPLEADFEGDFASSLEPMIEDSMEVGGAMGSDSESAGWQPGEPGEGAAAGVGSDSESAGQQPEKLEEDAAAGLESDSEPAEQQPGKPEEDTAAGVGSDSDSAGQQPGKPEEDTAAGMGSDSESAGQQPEESEADTAAGVGSDSEPAGQQPEEPEADTAAGVGSDSEPAGQQPEEPEADTAAGVGSDSESAGHQPEEAEEYTAAGDTKATELGTETKPAKSQKSAIWTSDVIATSLALIPVILAITVVCVLLLFMILHCCTPSEVTHVTNHTYTTRIVRRQPPTEKSPPATTEAPPASPSHQTPPLVSPTAPAVQQADGGSDPRTNILSPSSDLYIPHYPRHSILSTNSPPGKWHNGLLDLNSARNSPRPSTFFRSFVPTSLKSTSNSRSDSRSENPAKTDTSFILRQATERLERTAIAASSLTPITASENNSATRGVASLSTALVDTTFGRETLRDRRKGMRDSWLDGLFNDRAPGTENLVILEQRDGTIRGASVGGAVVMPEMSTTPSTSSPCAPVVVHHRLRSVKSRIPEHSERGYLASAESEGEQGVVVMGKENVRVWKGVVVDGGVSEEGEVREREEEESSKSQKVVDEMADESALRLHLVASMDGGADSTVSAVGKEDEVVSVGESSVVPGTVVEEEGDVTVERESIG